jgi:hypothetical protein
MSVKKLLPFLLIFSFTGISAQTDIRLGVCFDPIATWFSPGSRGIEKDGSRIGLNGGLMVENYFRPNYALATGLTLTSLGGNLMYADSVIITTGDNDDVMLLPGSTVSYNLTYLTVPISLKLKSNEIGYFKWFAQLGLMPQVNIGSKANATGNQLKRDNVSKETNLVNLSYFFGGGIEYSLGGETSLTAGIFFNNGFVDVLSNNKHNAAINFLTLRMGVLF